MSIDVSIVLVTYNRCKSVEHQLLNLERQTWPHDKFELVVVDDGGSDRTFNVVHGMHATYPIQYLWQEDVPWGNPRARNLGMRFARGEIILFNDDDTFFYPETIASHVRYHKMISQAKVMGLVGVCPEGREERAFSGESPEMFGLVKKWANILQPWPDTMSMIQTFMPKNCSMKRENAVRIGGFDEEYAGYYGWDDVDFNRRLLLDGVNPVFAADCLAMHVHPPESAFVRDGSRNAILFERKCREEGIIRNGGANNFLPDDGSKNRLYRNYA